MDPSRLTWQPYNNSPRGLWSDGAVMYVADASDDKVYTYNMPDAIDARLASLSLSDLDIGEFASPRTRYDAIAAYGVTETTVEATTVQPEATVAIAPDDAGGDPENGHQAALAHGAGEVAITVTSADGSRERVYRVVIESAVERIEFESGWTWFGWPGAGGAPIAEALRGPGEDTDVSQAVAIIYSWDEGARTWLVHVPGYGDVPFLKSLATFEQGAEYWIATTQSVTWTVAIDLAAAGR